MPNPDFNAAVSEIRTALSGAAFDARKMLVVVGRVASGKLTAFQSAAEEAGLKVTEVSLASSYLTPDELNKILNQPSSSSEISYLLLDQLDEASEEMQQEIEDALQARSYLSTTELWRLPRIAAVGQHTPHWLPENLRTEVTMPVPMLTHTTPATAFRI